jgi:hypothetical protein
MACRFFSRELEPMTATEFPTDVGDPWGRRRLVDLLVALEWCRHPGDPARADRVEQYVHMLDADQREPLDAARVRVRKSRRGGR